MLLIMLSGNTNQFVQNYAHKFNEIIVMKPN